MPILDRRQLLAGTAALGATAAFPAFAQGTSPDLAKLFDTLFYEQIALSPESATQLGLDKGARADLRGKLSDQGEAGRDAARMLTQSQIARLSAIDRTTLSDADRLNLDVVLYTRRASADVQAFPYGGSAYGPTPYVISQQSGAYQSVPDFLDTKHPVATKADADAYLSRLQAFAGQMDAQTQRMRHDVALGVVPPDFILDKALGQMTALRVPAAQAKLVQSLARRAADKGLGDHAPQATAIYDAAFIPALDRQIAAVREARTKATHDAGIWRVPQGADFYRVALRNTTTSAMTPEQVHAFGIEQAKAISARMDGVMRKAGMTQGTVAQRIKALHESPGQIFPNTDAGVASAIAYCNARLAAIRGRLPEVFSRMPPYQFEVRRVPKETEAGAASAFSQSPALDGSRPGLVYFNFQDTHEWPKFMLATVVYHEGLPGHQFEGGLALSNTALPLIRKTGGFSGYGEGWALYAEQVADELGMYDGDPDGQLGYLKEQLFRAHRCIVDTGLHHYRWSKEKAVAFFVDELGETPGFATREVERYCVNPGQACSYKIGHSTFTDLRERAKAKMGAGFGIKAFHDAVLGCGRVPLEILEQVGNRWMGGVSPRHFPQPRTPRSP